MKLRNHISPVVCLVVALASFFGANAAVAQMAYPMGPSMSYGRQSLFAGRFYFQAGVQYRNLQSWGFQKTTRPISYTELAGVPPFGPNKEGVFGGSSGVPGYPEYPTGHWYWVVDPMTGALTPTQFPDKPDLSGIWNYDDGAITPWVDMPSADGCGYSSTAVDDPYGPHVWPFGVTGNGQRPHSLGNFKGEASVPQCPDPPNPTEYEKITIWSSGIFSIKDPSKQIDDGFDVSNPPAQNTARTVTWSRVMNDSLPEEYYDPYAQEWIQVGAPSRVWKIMSGEIRDGSNSEEVWTPTFEVGFQWTNLFDFFYGFSWFSLEKSLNRQFVSPQAELWRRGFKDTFSFWSDSDSLWAARDFSSNTAGQANLIQPDSCGPGGGECPRRAFFEVRDDAGVDPKLQTSAVEKVNARTDVSIYEHRLGARSWTPLYGMGRFGVTGGALINMLYFRTSLTESAAFTRDPNSPYPFPQNPWVVSATEAHQGWLMSYGLFTAVDAEIDYNNFFFRSNVQYNLSEEKQLQNSPNVWTNLNLSGFSALLAGGVRF